MAARLQRESPASIVRQQNTERVRRDGPSRRSELTKSQAELVKKTAHGQNQRRASVRIFYRLHGSHRFESSHGELNHEDSPLLKTLSRSVDLRRAVYRVRLII
jgi:hypothetical protein